jgi:hypothetical protein
MSECFLFEGQWLCSANACLEENQEKSSGKHLKDEADLYEYRDLVARAQNTQVSSY